MTHGELLDRIYWHWKNANDSEFHGLSGYRKALRAVVELHKPQPSTIPTDPKCTECSGLDWADYPCKTIQKIMDELN